MKPKKSLITKMRNELKKDKKKKELENEKKNNAVFEDTTKTTPLLPKI